MSRLEMTGGGGDRSLWRKIKDVALTDVGVAVRGIDEDAIAGLERVLLEADFGVDAATGLVDELERAARKGEVTTEAELRARLRENVLEILREAETGPSGELRTAGEGPTVVLVVGVNGTGKTTTVAKLAHRHAGGEGTVLAATDTFRAGAQDQLLEWADRLGARFVGGQEKGDPAAVAYDGVEAAREGGADLALLDTAGRLHTRGDLMAELEKIDRVVGRLVEGAPHERLLVVDATSGQNVLRQARRFGESLELTGLVLAKFDSTARGGTAVAVARELGLPVRYLGTGEGLADLEPFDPEAFVDRVLGEA